MESQQEKQGVRHYRSIVIPYRPVRWGLVSAAIAAVLALLVFVGLQWGGHLIYDDYSALQQQRDHLQAVLSERDAELSTQRQQLVNLQVGSKVDRKSVEEIRLTVAELQQRIAELTEENTFYKGLMAPSEREQGLSIRDWTVFPQAEGNRYHYKLVVQQVVRKHALLKGHVTVDLVGVVDGTEKRLPLAKISEQAETERLKLRFKYFQTIEGELQLPAGFRPQRVEVVAQASAPKYARVDKQFVWADIH